MKNRNPTRKTFATEKKRFLKESKKVAESAPITLLAAGIAHEFHNLLGAADGHAAWALESKNPKDMVEALEIVRLVCLRSSQITRSLQGFSQPREENSKEFSLKNLFLEIEKFFLKPTSEKNIKLKIKPSSINIKAKKLDIEEVLINLIKNAVESLEFFDGPKTIEVFALKKGKFIEIHVKDSGPGIPSIEQDHIFKPFWTTKGVLKHLHLQNQKIPIDSKHEGSGLGLYISRMRILEHGGQLKLQSCQKGAHFIILLPAST